MPCNLESAVAAGAPGTLAVALLAASGSLLALAALLGAAALLRRRHRALGRRRHRDPEAAQRLAKLPPGAWSARGRPRASLHQAAADTQRALLGLPYGTVVLAEGTLPLLAAPSAAAAAPRWAPARAPAQQRPDPPSTALHRLLAANLLPGAAERRRAPPECPQQLLEPPRSAPLQLAGPCPCPGPAPGLAQAHAQPPGCSCPLPGAAPGPQQGWGGCQHAAQLPRLPGAAAAAGACAAPAWAGAAEWQGRGSGEDSSSSLGVLVLWPHDASPAAALSGPVTGP
jgi:hypothetical protein